MQIHITFVYIYSKSSILSYNMNTYFYRNIVHQRRIYHQTDTYALFAHAKPKTKQLDYTN